jgi:hypothetical protein
MTATSASLCFIKTASLCFIKEKATGQRPTVQLQLRDLSKSVK